MERKKGISNVVIVDAHTQSMVLMRDILRYLGIETEHVRAYESINPVYFQFEGDKRPDLLITDVGRDTNGDTLLEKLVKEGKHTPTIVVSAGVMCPSVLFSRFVEAIYYSQQMYTPEQRAILGINQPKITEDQVRTVSGQDLQAFLDPYFTALVKPFMSMSFLGDRVQRIQKELYNN